MRFARRARWLTELFTPSVSPPTHFPDSYSRDVSLVQPYDGGGVPIPSTVSLIRQATTAAAAAGSITLLTTSREEVARLYSLGGLVSAGANATVIFQLEEVDTGNAAPLAPRISLTGDFEGITTPGVMIPPNHNLVASWAGGDVLTILIVTSLAAVVPSGTVFYC